MTVLVPNLSASDLDALEPHAPHCRGDRRPAYGASFEEAVTKADWLESDWLECVVMAGHAPSVAGLAVALRALHLYDIANLREYEADGADGDAIDWARGSVDYRKLIVILELSAAALETELARLLSKPVREYVTDRTEREALFAFDAHEAAAAKYRARRAKERAASAAADNAVAVPTQADFDEHRGRAELGASLQVDTIEREDKDARSLGPD